MGTDGYEQPQITGSLDFVGGPLEGARVECRFTVPLGVYFDILEGVDSGTLGGIRAALGLWADEALVSWNLLDPKTHRPLPATREGFFRLSLQVGQRVVKAWVDEVPDVDLPLGGASPDGATSKEPQG